MNKPLLKWSAAQPIRAPDNIISSRAREKKQLGFIPTYENQPSQHMNFLMSNEYMKMWFKERSKYEKDTYTREQIIKEECKIKRRICQRMMTYRKPTKNQFIEDFLQKPKIKGELLENTRLKYKPKCQKKKSISKEKEKVKEAAKEAAKESAKEAEEAIEDVVICTSINCEDCEENK